MPTGFSMNVLANISGNDLIEFQITVPENNYFAVQFGRDFNNTDTVIFQGNGSVVDALWRDGEPVPTPDQAHPNSTEKNVQSYNQSFSSLDGITSINASRYMRSVDPFDFNVTCEKNYELSWLANQKTQDFTIPYEQSGFFNLKIGNITDDQCKITMLKSNGAAMVQVASIILMMI